MGISSHCPSYTSLCLFTFRLQLVSHGAYWSYIHNLYIYIYVRICICLYIHGTFMYVCVGRIKRVKSKWGVGAAAVLTVLASLTMSVGFCTYFGLNISVRGRYSLYSTYSKFVLHIQHTYSTYSIHRTYIYQGCIEGGRGEAFTPPRLLGTS